MKKNGKDAMNQYNEAKELNFTATGSHFNYSDYNRIKRNFVMILLHTN